MPCAIFFFVACEVTCEKSIIKNTIFSFTKFFLIRYLQTVALTNEFFHSLSSSEFNLTFRTTKEDGMIFYIEGQFSRTSPYDFESLYIRNGKLNHLVFNPEPTGIGSSFGSHVNTDFDVNTDDEIRV